MNKILDYVQETGCFSVPQYQGGYDGVPFTHEEYCEYVDKIPRDIVHDLSVRSLGEQLELCFLIARSEESKYAVGLKLIEQFVADHPDLDFVNCHELGKAQADLDTAFDVIYAMCWLLTSKNAEHACKLRLIESGQIIEKVYASIVDISMEGIDFEGVHYSLEEVEIVVGFKLTFKPILDDLPPITTLVIPFEDGDRTFVLRHCEIGEWTDDLMTRSFFEQRFPFEYKRIMDNGQ